jgi:UDP-N-acetylglucosamine transferase subunit ALG13
VAQPPGLAIRPDHTPVVVPRRCRCAETVDDHQTRLVRALAVTGRIVGVEDVADLAAAVAAAPARRAAQRIEAGPLHAAVREALAAGTGQR